MLFLRAGTDGAFSNSSFKIHGLKYDPQIKQGAWQNILWIQILWTLLAPRAGTAMDLISGAAITI